MTYAIDPVYVVTDCEFDGPTPGRNSMLSFASVAVTSDGRQVDDFEAVLAPIDGAAPDPDTLAWLKNHPAAYAAATSNPRAAGLVMPEYVNWVRGLPGDPVFASHPLAVDGVWMDFYLRRFTQSRLAEGPWKSARLFRTYGLCIRSFAAGCLAWPLSNCDIHNYPSEWLGDNAHTHRAIDDAKGYACLLARLLRAQRADAGGRAPPPLP